MKRPKDRSTPSSRPWSCPSSSKFTTSLKPNCSLITSSLPTKLVAPIIWWKVILICAYTLRDCRRQVNAHRSGRKTCNSCFLANRLITRQGNKCPRSAATKTNYSHNSSLRIKDHICIKLGRSSTQNLTKCFPPPQFNTSSSSRIFCWDNGHRVTCKVWNISQPDHATTFQRAWAARLSPSKAPVSATPGMSPILAHTTTADGSSQTVANRQVQRLLLDFSPWGQTVPYTRIFYLEKFNLITI